ncbi:MAG: VTT domain-containing protein [Opitutaceae bacterium]
MSLEVAREKRKLPLVKIAIVAVVMGAAAVFLLRGVDVRGWIERGMTEIRERGPWVYFAAMTVLPALGAPLAAFTIPAGEAFAGQMGIGGVIAATLVAIALNLALAYWLARYAMRPVLTKLVERFGYEVPRVTPKNALNVLLIVRLTPGVPYPVQCFVLGIAEMPFRLYMIGSWLAIVPWALGAIILGKGLFNGNYRVAAIGVAVLVVAVAAVQIVRRRYFRHES